MSTAENNDLMLSYLMENGTNREDALRIVEVIGRILMLREKITDAVVESADNGNAISVEGDFVVVLPDETKEDLKELRRLRKEHEQILAGE